MERFKSGDRIVNKSTGEIAIIRRIDVGIGTLKTLIVTADIEYEINGYTTVKTAEELFRKFRMPI